MLEYIKNTVLNCIPNIHVIKPKFNPSSNKVNFNNINHNFCSLLKGELTLFPVMFTY